MNVEKIIAELRKISTISTPDKLRVQNAIILIEQLGKDKAMLDWLQTGGGRIAKFSDGWSAWDSTQKWVSKSIPDDNLRLAISTFMSKEAGE